MDYGLKVSNKYNAIQIDSLYRNMVVIERGSANRTKYSGCGDVYRVPFNFSSHPEAVIAVRPRGSNKLCSIGKSGSYFYAKIYSYHSVYPPVDYIIYGLPTSTDSSSSHGLQVFDPSARMVFDSGYAYMKTTDVMIFDVGENDSETGYVVRKNIPSGKSGLYILSMTSVCTSGQYGPGSWGYFPVDVRFIDGNRIEVVNRSGVEIKDFTLFLVEPP